MGWRLLTCCIIVVYKLGSKPTVWDGDTAETYPPWRRVLSSEPTVWDGDLAQNTKPTGLLDLSVLSPPCGMVTAKCRFFVLHTAWRSKPTVWDGDSSNIVLDVDGLIVLSPPCGMETLLIQSMRGSLQKF